MKMKTSVKYVIRAAVAALGVLLFYLSASAYGKLVFATDGILFYLEEPLGIQEAMAVKQDIEEKEKEMPTFCIWGQIGRQTLTNKYLKRSIQADVILLCGNSELLFEDCRVPAKKDSQGCVIDEAAAWELFGSTNVEGKEISFQEKSYTIRKVIPEQGKIFALQICGLEHKKAGQWIPSESGMPVDGQPQQEKDDGVLNRITMQKTEEKSLRDLEVMWNGQSGLSVTNLDVQLLRGVSGACVLLVPATSCIFFLGYLLCQYRQQKQTMWKAAVAVFGFIAAVSFFLLLKSHINIPDDYIPTRWSDFSFWSELWDRKQDTVGLLLKMPKTDLDTVWMESFGKAFGCGLLAEALTAGFLMMTRRK